MTTLNGHAPTLVPADLDDDAPAPAPPPVRGSGRVHALEQTVADRAAERTLLRQLAEINSDPIFVTAPSDKELAADRKVAETERGLERDERLATAKTGFRRQRRDRRQGWWDERAERLRDRILDPARNLGSDHRRWVFSAAVLVVLIAAGVLFMSVTVHHGLFGVNGSWTGYLVEPLASVLLSVSMIAQFTARQRGIDVAIGFVLFDVALALASVALNVIPWGIRFGWDAGSVTTHLLAPLLVVAAVVGWHLASGLYGAAIATSKDDPITRERLALLRHAVANAVLSPDASANQVIKYLRETLPHGIGHQEGRRIARLFLGY